METLYLLCGVLCDEEVWQGQLPALRAQYDVRVVSFQAFDTLAAMAEHVLAGAPEQITPDRGERVTVNLVTLDEHAGRRTVKVERRVVGTTRHLDLEVDAGKL